VDVKFEVSTPVLAPIVLDTWEWVDVVLPDGRQVTVYADAIRVATSQDVFGHKDGRRIWEASAAPYGKVIPLAACAECGGSPVVAHDLCGRCYKRGQRARKKAAPSDLAQNPADVG
jgi:hypothetical protein